MCGEARENIKLAAQWPGIVSVRSTELLMKIDSNSLSPSPPGDLNPAAPPVLRRSGQGAQRWFPILWVSESNYWLAKKSQIVTGGCQAFKFSDPTPRSEYSECLHVLKKIQLRGWEVLFVPQTGRDSNTWGRSLPAAKTCQDPMLQPRLRGCALPLTNQNPGNRTCVAQVSLLAQSRLTSSDRMNQASFN